MINDILRFANKTNNFEIIIGNDIRRGEKYEHSNFNSGWSWE
jgi:hypothetical protein